MSHPPGAPEGSGSERWDELWGLFDRARDLPVDQREAFLQEACPEGELRAEVRALLAAHDAVKASPGRFLADLDPAWAAALLGPEEHDTLPPGTMMGRYRIEGPLGRGGMGVVYHATDARLGRPAALKLLPAHLSMDAAARQRFEEEARAASALDHPHIATIYEIGEAPVGRVFLAMARYEGETIRQKLDAGPLPLGEAISLATQIADALAAAHACGIVHRDIKPENVIVTPEGVVKILDFGIAKVAGSALTRREQTLGTAAYMSPEQTRGGAVDGRSDLWSLGVVLYEMLTGTRPFQGEHNEALIYAIRHDRPKPLRRHRPDAGGAIARVVGRCLRKDPAQRYPGAAELLADLQRLAAAADGGRVAEWRRPFPRTAAVAALPLALLVVAGSVWVAGRSPAADVGSDAPVRVVVPIERRVAVLPLVDGSADSAEAFFADGLTQEMMTALAGYGGLRVIARGSAARYAGSGRTLGQIGRELGVGAVLDGSMLKDSDRVRLSMRLRSASTGTVIWSEEYGAPLTGMGAILDEIARGVAGALVRSGEGSTRLVGGGTRDTEAYRLYLQGRYLLSNMDRVASRRAVDYFNHALERDPGFARAYSGMADAYTNLAAVEALPAGEAYPRARAAAERALELEPDLAEAHASLGRALSLYYWEMPAAELHFRRALELDPSSATAHDFYTEHLRNLGRFEEALTLAERARELDPLSASAAIETGIVLYVSRRHDAALEEVQRLIDAAPAFTFGLFHVALVQMATGRYDDALTALDAMDPDGHHPGARAVRGMIYARTGRHEEARAIIDVITEQDPDPGRSAFQRAVIHVHLGEHERALDLLERAAEERTQLLQLLGVEPIVDPLRPHPRFQALLKRVGLAGS